MTLVGEALARAGRTPLLVAHRGSSARHPENTELAFRAARAEGADGIELDVQLTADGVVIVLHDDTLERTTDGTGPVAAWRAADVARLDAGAWRGPAFRGLRVPTLDAVLEAHAGGALLQVELKAGGGAALADAVVDLVAARGAGGSVLLSSFDDALLAHVRRRAPDIALGLLREAPYDVGGVLEAADALGATTCHPAVSGLPLPAVTAWRDGGLAVLPWVVNDPAAADRLVAAGAAGVFTDDPAALRRGRFLA